MVEPAKSRAFAIRGQHLWLLARHDFRQPAQALGLLANAIAQARSASEIKAVAVSVGQVAAGLDDMIAGLSLLARLEAGELKPAPVATPLDAAVADALAGLATNGPYLLDIERSDFRWHADPDLAGQALRGIVLFALRATKKGSAIALAASRRRGLAAIRLEYAGRDPAPALAHQAFVELPPADTERGRPLVGLGLALVARLATAMGGKLEAGSESDGRRQIALHLPAVPAGQGARRRLNSGP